MNYLFILRSFILGLSGILLTSSSVNAALFSFSPKGQQLDGDAILDIVLNPGDTITFTTSVDTTGLPGNIGLFSYSLVFDNSELELIDIKLDVENKFTSTRPIGPGLPNFPEHSGASIEPGTTFDLDIFTFRALDTINDGVADVELALSVAAESNIVEDYTNMFPFPEDCDLALGLECNQKVEVQPTIEPTTTFGLLALSIFGTASTVLKNKKTRSD